MHNLLGNIPSNLLTVRDKDYFHIKIICAHLPYYIPLKPMQERNATRLCHKKNKETICSFQRTLHDFQSDNTIK